LSNEPTKSQVEAQALPETVEGLQNLKPADNVAIHLPTKEEAAEAVSNFKHDEIEDLAWLVHTFLIKRHVEIVPEDCASEICQFMEIWDEWEGFLIDGFSREEQLSRIRAVVKKTSRALEKQIKEQHDMELRIVSMLRNLMIAGSPA
jgi:hypothetical protein